MNVRQMKKYIKKYGIIISEGKEPKCDDPYSIYYGKERYFIIYNSEYFDMITICGGITRRKVYASIIRDIKGKISR